MKVKYNITDEDIYNFDKTGFIMGMIFNGMIVTLYGAPLRYHEGALCKTPYGITLSV
jgi:hypothetical protein